MTTPLLRLHDWSRLDREARHDLLRRPAQRDQEELMASSRRIVEQVRQHGDAALFELIYSGITDNGMPSFAAMGSIKVWQLTNYVNYRKEH